MITLKKQKDKDFTILNLTDIHLRNKSWLNGTHKMKIVTYIIKTVIERARPDLITVTGDISKPNNAIAYGHTAEFLDSFGIPWAVVWGNHDQEEGTDSLTEAENIFMNSKYCLYERGDVALGRGNYVIGIEEEGSPIEALIMMDTHYKANLPDENGVLQKVNAKITSDQISWYKEQIASLKAAGYKESSIFIHIPIFAYREAFDAALIKGLNPREITYKESFSPVFWNKGYKGSFGVVHDKITSYPVDDGVFDAILEEDHTKTVVCGHDHKNSFVITHKGVRFIYGIRSSGVSFPDKQTSGGTVIRIGSNGVNKVEHITVNEYPSN